MEYLNNSSVHIALISLARYLPYSMKMGIKCAVECWRSYEFLQIPTRYMTDSTVPHVSCEKVPAQVRSNHNTTEYTLEQLYTSR